MTSWGIEFLCGGIGDFGFSHISSRVLVTLCRSCRRTNLGFIQLPFIPQMGAIIYWALLRFVIVLFGMWALKDQVAVYGDWWTMFFVAVYVVVLYPAQLMYRKHNSSIRQASTNGLCASCKHYVHDTALCGVLDEHVTFNYTPCEGTAWEPVSVSVAGVS
jgi:hypothetical protein